MAISVTNCLAKRRWGQTPTGFHSKAQGWRSAAQPTLGINAHARTNPNGVPQHPARSNRLWNPVGVRATGATSTQGRLPAVANPGFCCETPLGFGGGGETGFFSYCTQSPAAGGSAGGPRPRTGWAAAGLRHHYAQGGGFAARLHPQRVEAGGQPGRGVGGRGAARCQGQRAGADGLAQGVEKGGCGGGGSRLWGAA